MISYLLADPTGNITALVESPVSPEKRAEAAAAIMAAEPRAEQLGFLSPGSGGADIALYMAGGEFCGNACLSAAAYCLRRRGEETGKLLVDISGADEPVSVEIRKEADGSYSGTVDMPLPLGADSMDGFPLVRFPGISHLILPHSLSSAEAEAMIAPLCGRLGAEALGLMLFDPDSCALRPLVYVPGAGSLFWERSCASGSSALGAAMAAEKRSSVSLSLSQPGGTLSIEAIWRHERVAALRLGGHVRLLPEKNIEISKNFDHCT